MLTKVTINRYRSCSNLTLSDLGPTVVLVGRNGAGKSNILRSIMWAVEVALRAGAPTRNESDPSVSIEFGIGSYLYFYSIETRRVIHPVNATRTMTTFHETISVRTPNEDWRVLAAREGNGLSIAGGPAYHLDADFPLLTFLADYPSSNGEDAPHFQRIAEFFRRIRYYSFDEPNDSSEKPAILASEYDSWLSLSENAKETETSVQMKLLLMYHTMRDELAEVQSILCAEGLELLESLEVHEYHTDPHPDRKGRNSVKDDIYRIKFFPNTNGIGSFASQDQAFSELSLGTRRIIRIVVAMIFDRSSVMLIEHPEDGIHKGLTRKLFGLLRSYSDPAQMIMTSHSELVLDELRDDPGAVRFVVMEDGFTKAHALSPEESVQARKYIHEDGSFSEFIESRFDL